MTARLGSFLGALALAGLFVSAPLQAAQPDRACGGECDCEKKKQIKKPKGDELPGGPSTLCGDHKKKKDVKKPQQPDDDKKPANPA